MALGNSKIFLILLLISRRRKGLKLLVRGISPSLQQTFAFETTFSQSSISFYSALAENGLDVAPG